MIPNMLINSSRVPKMTLQVKIPPMLFGMPLQVHEQTPEHIYESQQLDEYGFIIMSPEARDERTRRIWHSRYLCGGGHIGTGSRCKGLCENLPHNGGRRVSYKKTGEFYCKDCGVVMKCARCRCCGNMGRKEPRRRNRDNEKRID